MKNQSQARLKASENPASVQSENPAAPSAVTRSQLEDTLRHTTKIICRVSSALECASHEQRALSIATLAILATPDDRLDAGLSFIGERIDSAVAAQLKELRELVGMIAGIVS